MLLKQQVVTAAKWSAATELATKAVAPVVFVVLARLLSPADFGVVATAAMVIAFAQLFWDAGMSQALIQRAGDGEDAATVVFWINVVLGIIVYLVFFFGAGIIAELFDDPRVTAVIRIQGLQIILMSFTAVHTALFTKQLDFKPLFWIQISSSLLPGMASVVLALVGMSYWALVIGALTGSMLQTILFWRMSSWRPMMRFNIGVARSMFRFGAWATAESLLSWFFSWGDVFVVGAILTVTDLGLYRTGNTLLAMVFGVVLAPLAPVLFSAFSRLQHDKGQLRGALIQATKAICLAAVPLGAAAFVLSDNLATAILGSNWQGIGPVLGWMGLVHAVSWTVSANTSAYRALGRPDINVKMGLAAVLLYAPVYLFAAPYGLATFLVARFAVSTLVVPLQLAVAYRLLDLHWGEYFGQIRWFLLGSVLAAVAVTIAKDTVAGLPQLAALVTLALLGLIVYVLVLLPERRFLIHLWSNMNVKGLSRRESD